MKIYIYIKIIINTLFVLLISCKQELDNQKKNRNTVEIVENHNWSGFSCSNSNGNIEIGTVIDSQYVLLVFLNEKFISQDSLVCSLHKNDSVNAKLIYFSPKKFNVGDAVIDECSDIKVSFLHSKNTPDTLRSQSGFLHISIRNISIGDEEKMFSLEIQDAIFINSLKQKHIIKYHLSDRIPYNKTRGG
jgi:hypothetical protein